MSRISEVWTWVMRRMGRGHRFGAGMELVPLGMVLVSLAPRDLGWVTAWSSLWWASFAVGVMAMAALAHVLEHSKNVAGRVVLPFTGLATATCGVLLLVGIIEPMRSNVRPWAELAPDYLLLTLLGLWLARHLIRRRHV